MEPLAEHLTESDNVKLIKSYVEELFSVLNARELISKDNLRTSYAAFTIFDKEMTRMTTQIEHFVNHFDILEIWGKCLPCTFNHSRNILAMHVIEFIYDSQNGASKDCIKTYYKMLRMAFQDMLKMELVLNVVPSDQEELKKDSNIAKCYCYNECTIQYRLYNIGSLNGTI